MSAGGRRAPVEFEVVGVAAGAGIVSGALALADPALASLTAVLAALAFAGWAAARSRSPRRASFDRRTAAALAALALGALVFVAAPSPIGTARALLLGLTLVPLWWTAPREPAP